MRWRRCSRSPPRGTTRHLSRPGSPSPLCHERRTRGQQCVGPGHHGTAPRAPVPKQARRGACLVPEPGDVDETERTSRPFFLGVFFVFGEGLWGFVWSNGTQRLFFVVCKQQNLSRAGVHDVCLCAAAFLFHFLCVMCVTRWQPSLRYSALRAGGHAASLRYSAHILHPLPP
jgi:hypothetical protein